MRITTAFFLILILTSFMVVQVPVLVASEIKVGMTEPEVRQLLKPQTLDTGTVYWGGTGARRIYFHISATEQVWVEFSGGPESRVIHVGKTEPKQKWIRHHGDSISVEDGPRVLTQKLKEHRETNSCPHN